MNDLKGTKLKVFSVIQNCNTLVTKKLELDLDQSVSGMWFERSHKFVKDQCKRIWNEIENGYYEYDELKIYTLYTQCMTGKRIQISGITRKNVGNVMELFTDKRYKEDQAFIIDVNKKTNLNGIEDYFRINIKGRSIVYGLIQEQYISPYFFIKLKKKAIVENQNKKNGEYIQFELVMNTIEKTLDKTRIKKYINNIHNKRCTMA